MFIGGFLCSSEDAGPFEGFEVDAEGGHGGEAFFDQVAAEAEANGFDFGGLFGVGFAAAEAFMKNGDGVGDVLALFVSGGATPIVKVDQRHVVADAAWLDEDVLAVDVAVVFAHGVDGFESAHEVVEYVQRLVGGEAIATVMFEKIFERFTFDKVGDEGDTFFGADGDDFGVVVLQDDGAVAQCV